MTPAARGQAAIDILDRVVAGDAAERALTGWARASRHAGSKDRAAVRDHVFDALRRWWSSAALGGGETGRARMIGTLRATGIEPATLFTGTGYGPASLSEAERVAGQPDRLAALDCPPWLAPQLETSLGADFEAVMEALRHRAPVMLRVNQRCTTVSDAIAELGGEGIETCPHPLSPGALEVTGNARRVHMTAAYREGRVELQDAASQAVVDALPLCDATRILDYCAGGGGKALAMAAASPARIDAHDVDPARLGDLPDRAARAGVEIARVATAALPRHAYDLVLVDAPCSGSGAWRRSPEGKIRLDAARLDTLARLQRDILHQAADHVRQGGVLAYATCSLLDVENGAAREVAAERGWSVERERRFTPLDGADGFYLCTLRVGG